MPRRPAMDLTVSAHFPQPASEVFASLLEELATSLGGAQLRLEPGRGGRIQEHAPGRPPVEVARVVRWDPFRGIVFAWHPPAWSGEGPTRLEVRLEPEEKGTRVTFEHRGWGGAVGGDRGEELVGWFTSEVASTVFRASSPSRLGDWLTDRRARRPSGAASRAMYRTPVYHLPNFGAILQGLDLRPEDRLLEVGCGGGAFLRAALRSGCSAAAIDHSPELLRVAAEQNRAALRQGRLRLVEGEADRLPFPRGSFSCAVMTGVLGFLPHPEATFQEIHRVLRPGGRLAVFSGTRALRGTPAAPSPMAERIRFYEDRELTRLARRAGFVDVRVLHPDLSRFARDAGLPPRLIGMFRSGKGAQLLWARRGRPAATSPRTGRKPARRRGLSP